LKHSVRANPVDFASDQNRGTTEKSKKNGLGNGACISLFAGNIALKTRKGGPDEIEI